MAIDLGATAFHVGSLPVWDRRDACCEQQVVAIDMRGFGESDKPVGREHYVIPTLASDAAEVVKALGHDK